MTPKAPRARSRTDKLAQGRCELWAAQPPRRCAVREEDVHRLVADVPHGEARAPVRLALAELQLRRRALCHERREGALEESLRWATKSDVNGMGFVHSVLLERWRDRGGVFTRGCGRQVRAAPRAGLGGKWGLKGSIRRHTLLSPMVMSSLPCARETKRKAQMRQQSGRRTKWKRDCCSVSRAARPLGLQPQGTSETSNRKKTPRENILGYPGYPPGISRISSRTRRVHVEGHRPVPNVVRHAQDQRAGPEPGVRPRFGGERFRRGPNQGDYDQPVQMLRLLGPAGGAEALRYGGAHRDDVSEVLRAERGLLKSGEERGVERWKRDGGGVGRKGAGG